MTVVKKNEQSGIMNKERIRFGVVGTNFITDWVIAGGGEDERFELVAVCSRKQESGAVFAKKHHISMVFTNLEEMAQSSLVDAIYIATPNSKHAEQAILCMKHGKHVLCEKPLASNGREADEMIAVAKDNGVVLMEAMKPTMTPNFDVIQSNLYRVGKVRHYISNYCQYSSRYDRFKAGELPNAFNPLYSNGALMDIGVYTLYPMIVLFGQPERISAIGTLMRSGVDGEGIVSFTYPEMSATIVYSKICNSFLSTEIQGEKGTLVIDRINLIQNVLFYPHTPKKGGKGERKEAVDLTEKTLNDEYYYEVNTFIDCVLNLRKLSETVNSLKNSRLVVSVMDEIRKQIGVVYPADKKG